MTPATILCFINFLFCIVEVITSPGTSSTQKDSSSRQTQLNNTWTDVLEYIKSVPRDNVTLIAWRKALHPNGNIKQLTAIQLEIPTEPATENVKKIKRLKYKFDRFEALQQYESSKASYEIYKSAKMPLEHIIQEQRNLEGGFENLLYMDDEGLVARDIYRVYVRKSLEAPSRREVAEFADKLKPTSLEQPSVLRYDSGGNLKVNESLIRFQLQGVLVAEDGASRDVTKHALKVVTRIALQYAHKDVPKKLAEYFNKKYPRYTWGVIVGPQDLYLAKNISLTLNFGHYNYFYCFDDEDQSFDYYVYGLENGKK